MSAKSPAQRENGIEREILADQLFEGVQALHLPLTQAQFDQLLDYLVLLNRWNGVYNLTAIRDPELMVRQHLLDSLSVVPAFYKSSHVLDVGSGGGLPGMVIAISQPDLKIDLIDSVQKKTAFLNQVKLELGLQNVEVHTGRVESLVTKDLFDTITSRAFSSLGDLIRLTQHLLAPSGKYIAMKGAVPMEEIENLPEGWEAEEIREVIVPGLNAERHIVIMRRSGE